MLEKCSNKKLLNISLTASFIAQIDMKQIIEQSAIVFANKFSFANIKGCLDYHTIICKHICS